ncbi:uncharacterized protein TNCV_2013821 [Trichonephila clavipes]|nr:uncharacterized protein TNCV_2013821 [Trichonephila clavipes]
MENTHRRPSGKRPKKRRFRGNQFMKVCSHTTIAERRETCKCASSNKILGIQTSLKSNLVKEVGEESMKRAAVEENSSSPDNLLTVSGDGTWKTRGHSSLIGVCTVIGAETGKKIECVGHVQKRMGTRLRKLKLVYGKKKLSDGKTIGGKVIYLTRGRHRVSFDQVSELHRGRRVAYRHCGLSFREIGQRVRRNQAIVMRICDFWKQEETIDQRGRSHKPRCTTARDDRWIVRMAEMNGAAPS